MNRIETKINKTEEGTTMTRPERLRNFMAALANTENGKYPHAFCMFKDDKDQPIVLAIMPKLPEAVVIFPRGMMILDLTGDSDNIEPNINYLRNQAETCDKTVELDTRMALGVAKMTPVNLKSPSGEDFERAKIIIRQCENYWLDFSPENWKLTTEELVNLF